LAPATAKPAPTARFDSECGFLPRPGRRSFLVLAEFRQCRAALVDLLATAQADNLNPRRYNARSLARAVADAGTGNPASIQRAEATLSSAFVTYARDLKHDPGIGIFYVDKELKPTPPSASELLTTAARAPSLSEYVQQLGWMNPIYAKLRQAIASRIYRNAAEFRLLQLNLERARALPSSSGRYVIVNPPAARLYMYENGCSRPRCASSPVGLTNRADAHDERVYRTLRQPSGMRHPTLRRESRSTF
jgi:murein L,D-transpeptidase YcbB/YkuD